MKNLEMKLKREMLKALPMLLSPLVSIWCKPTR